MLKALAILILAAPAALAEDLSLDTSGLQDCGTTTAAETLGGARFKTPEGLTVKLALVKAPEFWEPSSEYTSWPHAVEAKKHLMEVLRDQTVTLYCEGQKTNRLGELVAHAVMPDGSWLQHNLVRDGHVFVFPSPTRRRGLDKLYDAELEARAGKKGLWIFKNLQPVAATGNSVKAGWFQIVEGVVVDAAKVRDTIFLNFGDDWRTDFTVEIPALTTRYFDRIGLDPLSLEGQHIEVRGWIDFKSGPRLLLQGPGQIRIIKHESQP
ncbi:thermonuclease family protein [Kordiimonas sp.]|uniref:thermonuclease family protein n=1 Tax=Kordiimonas sp. TaxID=1970157 RepID=UPI003A8DE261